MPHSPYIVDERVEEVIPGAIDITSHAQQIIQPDNDASYKKSSRSGKYMYDMSEMVKPGGIPIMQWNGDENENENEYEVEPHSEITLSEPMSSAVDSTRSLYLVEEQAESDYTSTQFVDHDYDSHSQQKKGVHTYKITDLDLEKEEQEQAQGQAQETDLASKRKRHNERRQITINRRGLLHAWFARGSYNSDSDSDELTESSDDEFFLDGDNVDKQMGQMNEQSSASSSSSPYIVMKIDRQDEVQKNIRKANKKRLTYLMGHDGIIRSESALLSTDELRKYKREERNKEKKLRRARRRAAKLKERRKYKYWWDVMVVRSMYHAAKSKIYRQGIVIVILLNTIVMALPYYGQSDEYYNVLKFFAVAVGVLFVLEFLMKVIGLGLKKYIRDPANCLDGFIVILWFVEMLLFISNCGLDVSNCNEYSLASTFTGLQILRNLRVLRIFRLFEISGEWKDMKRLLSTISQALSDVIHSSFLLIIFLFFMTAVGNVLFGGTMQWYYFDISPHTMAPRAHYDNFGWGTLVVY
jgi:hypothetical protein